MGLMGWDGFGRVAVAINCNDMCGQDGVAILIAALAFFAYVDIFDLFLLGECCDGVVRCLC